MLRLQPKTRQAEYDWLAADGRPSSRCRSGNLRLATSRADARRSASRISRKIPECPIRRLRLLRLGARMSSRVTNIADMPMALDHVSSAPPACSLFLATLLTQRPAPRAPPSRWARARNAPGTSTAPSSSTRGAIRKNPTIAAPGSGSRAGQGRAVAGSLLPRTAARLRPTGSRKRSVEFQLAAELNPTRRRGRRGAERHAATTAHEGRRVRAEARPSCRRSIERSRDLAPPGLDLPSGRQVAGLAGLQPGEQPARLHGARAVRRHQRRLRSGVSRRRPSASIFATSRWRRRSPR